MMIAYYLDLAWRSLRRSPGLTVLMVLTIGIGVGACMTTLTVLHVLSADPLPGKSDRIFNGQMDPEPMGGYVPGETPGRTFARFEP